MIESHTGKARSESSIQVLSEGIFVELVMGVRHAFETASGRGHSGGEYGPYEVPYIYAGVVVSGAGFHWAGTVMIAM